MSLTNFEPSKIMVAYQTINKFISHYNYPISMSLFCLSHNLVYLLYFIIYYIYYTSVLAWT